MFIHQFGKSSTNMMISLKTDPKKLLTYFLGFKDIC